MTRCVFAVTRWTLPNISGHARAVSAEPTGAEIKARREAVGVSQAKIGMIIGMTEETVRSVEADRRVKVSTRKAVLDALDAIERDGFSATFTRRVGGSLELSGGIGRLSEGADTLDPIADRDRGEGWMPGQREDVLAAVLEMQKTMNASMDKLIAALQPRDGSGS